MIKTKSNDPNSWRIIIIIIIIIMIMIMII